MANAFWKYYRFNTKIVPITQFFRGQKKNSGESFHEYVYWLREPAAQMLLPMMENKIIKWFIDNRKPPHYDKMIIAQVTHFASLIPIDEGIRSKKIVDPEALNFMIEQHVKKATDRKG